ncbi:hypothetical protein P3G55_18000 [Leptospira sp. 96542]|nr:hypothetical protein [Leptospira sp. 96542]
MDWNFKIKKPEAGTPLSWEVYFPPGLAQTTGEKLQISLSEIQLPNQPEPKIRVFPEKIKLENTNAHQITYLASYAHYIRDIRLIVARTNDWDNRSEVREKEWDRVLQETVPIIKHLFRDTKFYEIKNNLHISFFEKELAITLSIFGEPSYKRGVKAVFPTSAPIPEDLASNLIADCFKHFGQSPDSVSSIYLPFAGTLTFITEWFLQQNQTSLFSLPRKFILNQLTLFPEKTLAFYEKKRQIERKTLKPQVIVQDTDPALKSYWDEEKSRWEKWIPELKNCIFLNSDFLREDLELEIDGNSLVFIPLNPPYGFRKNEIGVKDDSLYQNIGKQLNKLVSNFSSGASAIGFILCPTEEKWIQCMNEMKKFKKKTIHVTHGGIDLRVLYFYK